MVWCLEEVLDRKFVFDFYWPLDGVEGKQKMIIYIENVYLVLEES